MRLVIPSILAFLFIASNAHAYTMTVGGATCSSCAGSEITLDIIDKGGWFDVTLTLDSTDFDESSEGIAQIGFGAIKNWSSVSLESAPTALIAWDDPIHANIDSADLCGSTNGNSGKICTWGFTDITADDTYVWEFLVVGGKLKLGEGDWHIGGQFADYVDLTDDSDKTPNGDVISESGTPVPEPTAAVVFAAGLLVVGRGVRRRA